MAMLHIHSYLLFPNAVTEDKARQSVYPEISGTADQCPASVWCGNGCEEMLTV